MLFAEIETKDEAGIGRVVTQDEATITVDFGGGPVEFTEAELVRLDFIEGQIDEAAFAWPTIPTAPGERRMWAAEVALREDAAVRVNEALDGMDNFVMQLNAGAVLPPHDSLSLKLLLAQRAVSDFYKLRAARKHHAQAPV